MNTIAAAVAAMLRLAVALSYRIILNGTAIPG
jgi:hypothetical protein